MLQTEINSPEVESAVLFAAGRTLRRARLSTTFEHGQWWVTDLDTGGQWSVVDSNDPYGFSFEQVTDDDEKANS